ncbi:MAG: cytochrome ubiquinol oxidase subunit I [Legionellaceae bacterium]|nr:cytochrome ubiquinol oxidase subunit I [Legionellaceae bacterium]
MAIDSTFVSRVQFAFTISFHILFPAFSIGLATFLAIMEGVWLITKKPIYLSICKFWMKIFALTFGMGIVSGVVMEFQLGTNWSGFTKIVGPVLGSLFTYEVLTAFFIEAGFLGVMIFGWNRVGEKLHYVSTLLVFFGVTFSAFWILSANSWMQTPAGAVLKNHQFVVQSWREVIFNHSTVIRYLHMLLASYLATALVVAGISAQYLMNNKHRMFSKKCFSFAMVVIVLLIPMQIFIGDEVGLKVHEYQPIKTAAIEGAWNTQKGAPLLLVAWPNQAEQKNDFAIGIPHLASLINTHNWNGEVQGLKSVPRDDQPFVWLTFYSFRIMVGLGFLMLLLGLIGLYLRVRHRLYDQRWFLKLCVFSSPAGFVALITGWFTAETGRQPWVVYNLLRTSDAASRVSIEKVLISFVLLVVVYGIIFGVFYFRYVGKVLKKGPISIHQLEKPPFAYMQPPKNGGV